MDTIFTKKQVMTVSAVILTCMVIGSFYDYQISQALFNINSVYGIFFASFGQLPVMLLYALSGTLLIRIGKESKLFFKILCWFFGVLLNAFGLLGAIMDPSLNITNSALRIIAIVIGVVIVLGSDFFLWKNTANADRKTLKKIVAVWLIAAFAAIMIINMLKKPWSRPRFRSIVYADNATLFAQIGITAQEMFQPWWVIGCKYKEALLSIAPEVEAIYYSLGAMASEQFKSFPSGHTGNAACAMMFSLLPLIVNKLKGKEATIFYGGLVFTLLVAISRIIMGAHFLTDVTIGMTVTFVVSVILVKVFFKKA